MNKCYLSDHTKGQHAGDGSNSFVCHMCYARKPNSYLLKKHMQQHVESVCKVCEKQFNSTKNLKRHGKVHEVQRCKDCGIYFNSKKNFRNHKFQVHARSKGKKDDPFGGRIRRKFAQIFLQIFLQIFAQIFFSQKICTNICKNVCAEIFRPKIFCA